MKRKKKPIVRNANDFYKASAELDRVAKKSVRPGSAKALRLLEQHKAMGRFAVTGITSHLDQVESSVLTLAANIEEVCDNAMLPEAEQEWETDDRDYMILALYNYFTSSRSLRDCKEADARVEELLSPEADA